MGMGLRWATVVGMFALLGGCATIERERGYPGGNVGVLSDRLLFAKGPSQQVDRSLVALAFIAPLAAEAAGTPEDAQITARRIRTVLQRLKTLKDTAETCDYALESFQNCTPPVEGGEIGNTLYAFQTLSARTDRGLADLLKAVAESFGLDNLDDALTFDPSDLLGTISAARNLVSISQRYFASYRDVTVIVSASALRSCAVGACTDLEEKLEKLRIRTRIADFNLARDERPLGDLYNEAKAVIGGPHEWRLGANHVVGLIYHVDRACKRLESLQRVADGVSGDEPVLCSLDKEGTDPASKLIAAYGPES